MENEPMPTSIADDQTDQMGSFGVTLETDHGPINAEDLEEKKANYRVKSLEGISFSMSTKIL